MENSLSKMTYRNTHAQVQRPWGEILPGSPALFPVLFLCEEPVLFKYNGGVKETAAPVRQTLHHCDTESNDNKRHKLKPQKHSLHLHFCCFLLVPLLCKCFDAKNWFLKLFTFIALLLNSCPLYHYSTAESHTPRLHFWNTCGFLTVWLASKAEFTTRKQVNKIQKVFWV